MEGRRSGSFGNRRRPPWVYLQSVYTVRFKDAVYVLHAFQKKSTKGIKTAQTDVDLISRRLKSAKEDYEKRYGKGKE
jgi:phage-related protein